MSESAAVFAAIQTGDVERLKEILNRDPSLAAARDASGQSAVMTARYRARTDMLEVLLATSPPLDVFEATVVGRAERVRELLDEQPQLANAWSNDGFTPLHLAAFFGQPRIAELLLQRGADAGVAARNTMQVTPLNSAAAARQRAIAALLLDHGAPVDARQQEGWTPLHSAAHNGDVELLDLLLARGADRALRSDDGRDAVDMAREKGHTAVIERLQAAH